MKTTLQDIFALLVHQTSLHLRELSTLSMMMASEAFHICWCSKDTWRRPCSVLMIHQGVFHSSSQHTTYQCFVWWSRVAVYRRIQATRLYGNNASAALLSGAQMSFGTSQGRELDGILANLTHFPKSVFSFCSRPMYPKDSFRNLNS